MIFKIFTYWYRFVFANIINDKCIMHIIIADSDLNDIVNDIFTVQCVETSRRRNVFNSLFLRGWQSTSYDSKRFTGDFLSFVVHTALYCLSISRAKRLFFSHKNAVVSDYIITTIRIVTHDVLRNRPSLLSCRRRGPGPRRPWSISHDYL